MRMAEITDVRLKDIPALCFNGASVGDLFRVGGAMLECSVIRIVAASISFLNLGLIWREGFILDVQL
jgi:hypothetical protein